MLISRIGFFRCSDQQYLKIRYWDAGVITTGTGNVFYSTSGAVVASSHGRS
jgi:hypothetical protein